MWKIKLCYLLMSMSSGCFDPHLPVLLTESNVTTSTLGILSCVRTVVSIVFGFSITAFADRVEKHRLVAKACTYCTALFSLLFYFATISADRFADSQLALGLLFGVPLTLIAIARSPLGALESDAVMSHLAARGRKEEFGRVRLYGALGFGLSNGAVGFFIRNGDIKKIGLLFAGAMVGYGILSSGLFTDKKKPIQNSEKKESKTLGFIDSLKLMLHEKGFVPFAFVLVVMGYTHSVFSEYVALFINSDPQTSSSVFAWTGLAAMAGELPFFFFSDVLMRKFGAASVILTAQAGTALRLLGYGVLHGNALIAPQLLHGVTFSLMWASSVIYVDGLAPPHLSATAQSLLSILYGGVSAFVSSLVNGYLYEVGGKALVVGSSVTLVVVSIVVWVMTADFNIDKKKKSN